MNILKGIDTFYPFHNHAIPEIYYTIREPACAEEFLNFAIRENNPLLETVSETDSMREVEFDGSDEECDYTFPRKQITLFYLSSLSGRAPLHPENKNSTTVCLSESTTKCTQFPLKLLKVKKGAVFAKPRSPYNPLAILNKGKQYFSSGIFFFSVEAYDF